MHSRCRRGRFAVPVAVAGRFARTIQGLVPALKRLVEPATLGDPDATVDLGVEEHGEACHDPDADGASDLPTQCARSW